MKTINESIDALVRENIRRLKPYSSARHEFEGEAEVFLDANENPFHTGLNRYPDPLQHELKTWISREKGIAEEQIFLGNGSDEAIDLLVRIFCEPRRDHIIILPPTYGMYQVSADIADVAIREVLLKPSFQPDVEAILAAADQYSRLLFLCSPNNPSGNDIDREAIRDLCRRFRGIVVVDEAYIDFSPQASTLQLLSEFPNLVVLQTFSKAWGLAAIRLGMAFASREIIQYFNKVKPPYNVNELTQRAALEAIRRPDTQREMVAHLLEQRIKLSANLPKLPFVRRVYPSDANFLLVQVDEPDRLYQYLVGHGIIVRNRSRVPLCEGCLRITVGIAAENERLLNALESFR